MRPRGSYGGVALALRTAASESPGTVRQLAERASVAYGAARYTASRLVDAGELAVRCSCERPAVLCVPPMDPGGDSLGDALLMLDRSFWGGADMP